MVLSDLSVTFSSLGQTVQPARPDGGVTDCDNMSA